MVVRIECREIGVFLARRVVVHVLLREFANARCSGSSKVFKLESPLASSCTPLQHLFAKSTTEKRNDQSRCSARSEKPTHYFNPPL